MITFGEKLRYLRRKNNLTQKELGMAVGFPENTADVRIAQYETNARMPREELLKKLAQVLGVSLFIFYKSPLPVTDPHFPHDEEFHPPVLFLPH